MNIMILGSGYVGLVTGACLADMGHQVFCLDQNASKIQTLREGGCTIFEKSLPELLQRHRASRRLTFDTVWPDDLTPYHILFICVGTPEDPSTGQANVSYVEAVAGEIGRRIQSPTLVILKSTVPVGTCDRVEAILQKHIHERGLEIGVSVVSNPEFLQEGNAVKNFMEPDRIVLGLPAFDDLARQTLEALYGPFVVSKQHLIFTDRRSSELSKYACNAMLATRISFMNELSHLCEKTGADIEQIRLVMGEDPRIGEHFLQAGAGYGGSCFPKDVSALIQTAHSYGVDTHLLRSVQAANQLQIERLTAKVARYVGSLEGKTVAVWGLAFKADTDDVRCSPALWAVQEFIRLGASIKAHDPKAGQAVFKELAPHVRERFHMVDRAYDVCHGAVVLVVCTAWREYIHPDWAKIRSLMGGAAAVFDFRNQYQHSVLANHGFHYECVGRPDSYVEGDHASQL